MEDKHASLPYDPRINPDIEFKRKGMQRDLDRYDPRRLMITRTEVEALGLTYDGRLYGELEPEVDQPDSVTNLRPEEPA